jgi:outer membrane immunogenic protein
MPHRIVFACASVIALTVAANAADIYVPGPAPVDPGGYKDCCAPLWTGFYLGGNGGYGWGTANNNIAFTQTDPPFIASFNAHDSVKLDGAIGGGQIGYNWQVNRYLLGIEADIQASDQKGTNTFNGTIINSGTIFPNPATITDREQLDWFGTVRGRLGWTFDSWLVYGTGGLAYGEVSLKGNVQPQTPAVLVPFGIASAPIVWDHSSDKVGWVAGGGIENQISQHWSWKIEYLFMDLGSVSARLSGGLGSPGSILAAPGNCYGNPGGTCFFNPASGIIKSTFTDNIVRAGINYHIGADYVPLK